MSRNLKLRILTVALVMCLGFYPVAELTRVIWTVSYVYNPGSLSQWITETVIMWVFYLSIIPVLIFSNRWRKYL